MIQEPGTRHPLHHQSGAPARLLRNQEKAWDAPEAPETLAGQASHGAVDGIIVALSEERDLQQLAVDAGHHPTQARLGDTAPGKSMGLHAIDGR